MKIKIPACNLDTNTSVCFVFFNLFSQHQGLLERFEETLSEAGQDGDLETDYEANDQELGQTNRELNLDQERDREAFVRERPQSAESLSRTASQRNHLLDLLMSKRRAASCFGARMDRIGNAGGLGCNNGKGKTI